MKARSTAPERRLRSRYEAVSALAFHDVEGFFVGVRIPFVACDFPEAVYCRKVFAADELTQNFTSEGLGIFGKEFGNDVFVGCGYSLMDRERIEQSMFDTRDFEFGSFDVERFRQS